MSKKRIFKNANQASEDHFQYYSPESYSHDGTPIPRPSNFFRKAEDLYQHDSPLVGRTNDVEEYRIRLQAEKQKEQSYELSTKQLISPDYLRQVINNKNITDHRLKLLVQLLTSKVDYRTLSRMKQHLFDKFEGDRDIPVEDFKEESLRFLHVLPPEIEEKIIGEIAADDSKQLISRQKLNDLVDMYQFLPLKIKRDKNKSEDIYFILHSNKRGAPQNREQILQELREQNERMHLTKISTLVAIKMEEKFPTMAKAFLFFDVDGDRLLTRTEFAKGVEGLRVKLSKEDVDKVFDYLDKDKDQQLNYYEFCGLSEEKRRNIDPFESFDNIQSAKSVRPSELSLGRDQGSREGTGSLTEVATRRNANAVKFEDLESQAAMMMLINHGKRIKDRNISMPKQIRSNKDYTFGIKSTMLNAGSHKHIAPSNGSDTESHMKSIIQHTDNLRDGLERKISMKLHLDELRRRQHKTVMERITSTKASELRSQSVLANQALNAIGDNLELMKMQKGERNDASFADIEKEKYKLQRALLLPPIEKVKSLNRSLNPSYSSSPYHLSQIAHGRQSQPQLQKRIDRLNLHAPILSKKNSESAKMTARKGVPTFESALQKKNLEQFNSMIANNVKNDDDPKGVYLD